MYSRCLTLRRASFPLFPADNSLPLQITFSGLVKRFSIEIWRRQVLTLWDFANKPAKDYGVRRSDSESFTKGLMCSQIAVHAISGWSRIVEE